MEELSQEEQYQLMKGWLNERQWRLYVATEAKRIGVGGISQVAREAGVTRKTIRKGIGELEAGAHYEPGERLRKPGGGRKKVTEKDARLRADLEGMLPRDAQRDFDKQAEKQKADLDGDDVILCHTERGLREGLPHVRGWSVLDARLAKA